VDIYANDNYGKSSEYEQSQERGRSRDLSINGRHDDHYGRSASEASYEQFDQKITPRGLHRRDYDPYPSDKKPHHRPHRPHTPHSQDSSWSKDGDDSDDSDDGVFGHDGPNNHGSDHDDDDHDHDDHDDDDHDDDDHDDDDHDDHDYDFDAYKDGGVDHQDGGNYTNYTSFLTPNTTFFNQTTPTTTQNLQARSKKNLRRSRMPRKGRSTKKRALNSANADEYYANAKNDWSKYEKKLA
jgi:hypothetical protein